MDSSPATIRQTAIEFGLKEEEFDVILRRLNREPNYLELGDRKSVV